ncbi:flagellar basal body L-ring protein FlgH [Aliiroseovarius sp. PTFE2010]|uniref:flagellar basal body L-ring protein FlgH n=1 Tax=Aliiroseovarius sp. PTFE2010 TaxID=3417190 RepID=UPI003CEE9955
MRFPVLFSSMALGLMAACSDLDQVGRAPEFTPTRSTSEYNAMLTPSLPTQIDRRRTIDNASLWTSEQTSLLGDRRAAKKGDILTVVIEIDESAEISNSSARNRSGSESMQIPQLLGIPQRIDDVLPLVDLENGVSTTSKSSSAGTGSVRRNEKLELKIAATVIEVLPNGILHIQGNQEVRVNFEIRELLLDGYVRPQDISRQNDISSDKIASARISYGGRGQISQVQQPRYGQQIADIVLPF